MKFIFDQPENILKSRTILCSDAPIIIANMYKKDIEPISVNPILPFSILQADSAREDFYIIDIKHHADSSNFEIISCLKEILQTIKEILKNEDPNIILSEI